MPTVRVTVVFSVFRKNASYGSHGEEPAWDDSLKYETQIEMPEVPPTGFSLEFKAGTERWTAPTAAAPTWSVADNCWKVQAFGPCRFDQREQSLRIRTHLDASSDWRRP